MLNTKTEMRAHVRRLVGDAAKNQWIDSNVDDSLERGFDFTVSALVRDTAASDILGRRSAAVPLASGQGVYGAPGDSLGILEVGHRPRATYEASLTCGIAGETDHTAWAAVTDGSFNLHSDLREWRVTGMDFSAVTDMDGVATVIQAAVRAETGGRETCEWDGDDNTFILKVYSQIGYLEPAEAPEGTDISGAGWMNGRAASEDAALSHAVSADSWAIVPEERRGGFGGAGSFAGGNGLSSATSMFYGGRSSGLGCWRRVNQGDHIQIEPVPRQSRGLIQFIYIAEPVWPDADDERVHFMPRQFDTCVEFFAASDLSNEEVHDGAPIGAFGNLWRQTFTSMTGGRINRRVRSARRSIRRVR